MTRFGCRLSADVAPSGLGTGASGTAGLKPGSPYLSPFTVTRITVQPDNTTAQSTSGAQAWSRSVIMSSSAPNPKPKE